MFTFRSSLFGDCWQKMKIMKAEFELSESNRGLQSRKAGVGRVRDEQASSRMDDEGCFTPRQQADSHQRKDMIALATK